MSRTEPSQTHSLYQQGQGKLNLFILPPCLCWSPCPSCRTGQRTENAEELRKAELPQALLFNFLANCILYFCTQVSDRNTSVSNSHWTSLYFITTGVDFQIFLFYSPNTDHLILATELSVVTSLLFQADLISPLTLLGAVRLETLRGSFQPE